MVSGKAIPEYGNSFPGCRKATIPGFFVWDSPSTLVNGATWK
jgi:hypothetical protein